MILQEQTYNVSASKKGQSLNIEGTFAIAERKNNNKRVYPKHLLERERKKVEGQTLLGELSHPMDRGESHLKEVAINTEKLGWENNQLMGKAKVLTNTPNGKILEGLIQDGVSGIGISTRGTGDVGNDGLVKDSYSLISFDVVCSPSTGQHIHALRESQEGNTLNESDDEILNKIDRGFHEAVAEGVAPENHVFLLSKFDRHAALDEADGGDRRAFRERWSGIQNISKSQKRQLLDEALDLLDIGGRPLLKEQTKIDPKHGELLG